MIFWTKNGLLAQCASMGKKKEKCVDDNYLLLFTLIQYWTSLEWVMRNEAEVEPAAFKTDQLTILDLLTWLMFQLTDGYIRGLSLATFARWDFQPKEDLSVSSQCLKITQNVAFEFLNFGIFHQFLSY